MNGAMTSSFIFTPRALSLQLGGRAVLTKVRLAVARGRVTALIGPAGAGKSALLGILSGKLSPCSGTVEVDGRNIAGMSPHGLHRLGVRRVSPSEPDGRTVRECIARGAQWHVRGHHAALAQADDVARRMGLDFQLNKPAASLSLAGRKRLALARAVASRPRLLLLDDFMAGLNAPQSAAIVGAIGSLRNEGVTVLMAERVMPVVSKVADDVLVLAEGTLIAHGPPHAVSYDPLVVGAYAAATVPAHA